MLVAALPAFAQAPDPAGVWRLEYQVVNRASIPIVGGIRSTSRTWILARIHREGAQWMQDHRVCASAVTGGVVRSRLPPGFVSHVLDKSYVVTFDRAADPARYFADTKVTAVGYDPSCPIVPETMHEACAIDWDGDGVPGATIQVKAPLFSWVDVYVAQRSHHVLRGAFVSPERIEGRIEAQDMKVNVLGASNQLFASSPTTELVPDQTVFTMTRLPDGATCEDVVRPD